MSPTKESAKKGSAENLYILVDGENMDWTLSNILGRPPMADDRPRWEPVLRFAEKLWGGRTIKPLFFINVRPDSSIPGPFIQVLQKMGFHPVLLTGDENQSVVDIGIQRMMEALEKRAGDVLLLSHDKDFCEFMEKLNDGKRHIGVIAFEEHLAGAYSSIEGLEIFDIEHDAQAFPNRALERLSPIPIEEFDPDVLLDRLVD